MAVLDEVVRLAGGFSGTLGLWARSLETGETLAYNADQVFPAASTIKLPILYELYRQALSGRVDLGALLPVTAADVVPGTGVLKELSAGIRLPVRDLATLMIVVSDNTATNMLIDLVGLESVNAAMAELGLPEIRLENRLFRGRPGAPMNRATPGALGRLMERIARREVLTAAACDELIGILKRQHFKEQIDRYLPEADAFPDPDRPPPLVVASKGGAIRGTRNEVGAVWRQGRGYVICMMSRGCADDRYYPDNEAALLLARVSAAVYRHFTGGESGLAGPAAPAPLMPG